MYQTQTQAEGCFEAADAVCGIGKFHFLIRSCVRRVIACDGVDRAVRQTLFDCRTVGCASQRRIDFVAGVIVLETFIG